MEAKPQSILELLQGENKAFVIPAYQRNYDWNEKNCRKLLNDVKYIVQQLSVGCDYQHFIGCIVLLSNGFKAWGVNHLDVIDGQQRITTILLILKALTDLSQKKECADYAERTRSYLFDKEHKNKLRLNCDDNVQFTHLVNDRLAQCDDESPIVKNFFCIRECLEEIISQLQQDGATASQAIEIICQAMSKLCVVGIQMERGKDSPHLIFESINSTGMSLTASDLIRNYILMQADDMDRLCRDYWFPIERLLRRGDDYKALNAFFTHYAAYKKGVNIKEQNLYESFKTLMRDNFKNSEECLTELKNFSEIYSDLWRCARFYANRISFV